MSLDLDEDATIAMMSRYKVDGGVSVRRRQPQRLGDNVEVNLNAFWRRFQALFYTSSAEGTLGVRRSRVPPLRTERAFLEIPRTD